VAEDRAPDALDLVVVGLGYAGLPLARSACQLGWRVAGYDIDLDRVAALTEGHSVVEDMSDGEVAGMLRAGFTATTDRAVLGRAATVVICVPTPITADRQPDLGAVVSATEEVAARLRPGTLVVLESTSYPGTTGEVMQPILEAGGLRAGVDFHLAFAPERVDPGNGRFDLRSVPRVVGGVTPACTDAAAAFYRPLVDEVVVARGAREAEMSKLIENVYRQVNIALVNELAVVSRMLQVDLWDAMSCAATKPYGFQAFRPGPGVGGHCIPVDPHYLTYKVRTVGGTLRMAELADDINRGMPQYVVQRATELLNRVGRAVQGSRVLLLGVSYKPDVGDLRGSPAQPVAAQLLRLGAEVSYLDPLVPEWQVDGKSVPTVLDPAEAVRTHDLVILLQRHASFDDGLLAGCRLLFDSSGAARAVTSEVL
jgi:UDP-N-acetyl-D-glucosamine dehydrogenase